VRLDELDGKALGCGCMRLDRLHPPSKVSSAASGLTLPVSLSVRRNSLSFDPAAAMKLVGPLGPFTYWVGAAVGDTGA